MTAFGWGHLMEHRMDVLSVIYGALTRAQYLDSTAPSSEAHSIGQALFDPETVL